jgi:hypothetical protein
MIGIFGVLIRSMWQLPKSAALVNTLFSSINQRCRHLHFVGLDNQLGRIVIFNCTVLILCTNVDGTHRLLFPCMYSILYSSVFVN